jgi:predicted O-linked N-acetylglucosamine transferase (SPINDLY family)
MSDVRARLQRAVTLHQQGRLADAERSYRDVLAREPDQFDALNLLGAVRAQQGHFGEGADLLRRALGIKPDSMQALLNLGFALINLNQAAEAETTFTKALALHPGLVQAFYGRGLALSMLGRQQDALASFDRALTLKRDFVEALFSRGAILANFGKVESALADFDAALAIAPNSAEALNNRGNALRSLGRHQEALASFDKALALNPGYFEAICNRGVTFAELNRWEEAIASYDAALAINPSYAPAHYNRGNALQALKRHQEAVESFGKAIAVIPGYLDALTNCGYSLHELNRHGEAIANYETVLAVQPEHAMAVSGLTITALSVCDWQRTEGRADLLRARVAAGSWPVPAFTLMAMFNDSALHLKGTTKFIKEKFPAPAALWTGRVWRHEKIRVAYLSSDYHRHPVPYLIAQVFELHDRSRFEIHGISFGPDDGSDIRTRLVKGFDRFFDARSVADGETARRLNELEIDIAVDLTGLTGDTRPGRVLSYRPAPIQVNYLGYPGPMGADFIDYILADRIVLPFDQQPFFSEKIVHLPDCYQANDSKREIAAHGPSRAESGLPAQGFVFCCFNNNWKITPPMFDIWMRLMRTVDGSVLWLLQHNELSAQNLRKEAAARGVDPARLVFAGRVPLEQHLARHRHADLFLDTLPYNADTTGSDALWVGVPLVTCCGQSFAGRVATSLLTAVGLPELATGNLQEYEALALRLATEPALLQQVRAKLQDNRLKYPLFDSERICRHIESAYTTMWMRWQDGKPPQAFAVEPGQAS